MTTIEFTYAIGDRVKILALDLRGQVSGQMVDECGLSYRVIWWGDGKRESQWLFAFELEAA